MTQPTLHPAGTATWTSRRVSVEFDDDFDTAVAKYEQAAPLYPAARFAQLATRHAVGRDHPRHQGTQSIRVPHLQQELKRHGHAPWPETPRAAWSTRWETM